MEHRDKTRQPAANPALHRDPGTPRGTPGLPWSGSPPPSGAALVLAAFCYPDQFERAGVEPTGYYLLETPSHKRKTGSAELRLPWRPDNRYPEVERSFEALRAAFEVELAAAHHSGPMSERGELVLRPAVREVIAPAVVAERLLKMAG